MIHEVSDTLNGKVSLGEKGEKTRFQGDSLRGGKGRHQTCLEFIHREPNRLTRFDHFRAFCQNLAVPIGQWVVDSLLGKRFPQEFHGFDPFTG
ncbi:MAG: hypothetical protein RLZZ245_3000 [Verrucomicrobiota bacterium]